MHLHRLTASHYLILAAEQIVRARILKSRAKRANSLKAGSGHTLLRQSAQFLAKSRESKRTAREMRRSG